MPLPETIPTNYVVLASALLSGFIAYQSRKNGLETEWEREQFVNSRLAGSTFPSDTWGITCDYVTIVEDSGWPYRFKKFFTGRMSGEAAVSVKYQNASIPGEVWENENIKQILDVLDFEVEHVGTNDHIEPTHSKFVLDTVEWGDVVEFLHAVIEMEKAGRERASSRSSSPGLGD